MCISSDAYKQGDHILYHASPSDKIYLIKPGKGIETNYVLDFGKYKAPDDFYSSNFRDIMEFVEAANKHNYVFEIPNFSANDYMLVVACMKGGALYKTFNLKESNQNITYSSFYDDFNFTKPLALDGKNRSFYLDDKYFYFIITSEQFIDLAQESKNSENMNQWINDKGITEFSNPILVKCRLKIDL